MTAVVTHDALGITGSTGCVENVERVRCKNGNAFSWSRCGSCVVPVEPGNAVNTVVRLDGARNIATFLHNHGVNGSL